MKPARTFITNEKNKQLKSRLIELLGYGKELKFLIGFFYFSGISALYEGLKDNAALEIKVLVGLNADKQIHGLLEYGDQANRTSANERFDRYLTSTAKSINSEDFDNEVFYEQVKFFLELIRQGRLVIRKTYKPNHAKLYIFKLKEDQFKKSVFITGSSNLTKAGLSAQEEFNVEISDYGTEETEAFFDKLWAAADKITENDEFKTRLIDLIENKTLVAAVTPFEAFALVLKNYLEALDQKKLKQTVADLLVERGYRAYEYQLDAVRQALTMIEHNDGVIISDVVGLGKSVIAGLVAKSLGKRGVVICPPNLIGDPNKKSGWARYKEDFKLYDWEIRSRGALESVLELVKANDEYEVVIIDEAHSFRNQDTQDYELLSNICRGKIVILLTATPFNNSPRDIFSLLKLFIVPGKSKITLGNDLDAKFRIYGKEFDKLSFIKRHHNSPNAKKREKAKNYYEPLFESSRIELAKVTSRTKYIANQIKGVIEPVLIRRNRLDLKGDPVYRNELTELSEIADPKELFFELTEEQSAFYDRVINEYFCEDGRFKGAVYQPFNYEVGPNVADDEIGEGREKNRERLTQRNLYDFMRRLLVKRFESSFGAFRQSIENFIKTTEIIQAFIEKTGKHILDRKLIEKIYELDSEEIEEELKKFAEKLEADQRPKTDKIYEVDKFHQKNAFFRDIESDLALYRKVLEELHDLRLVEDDPKLRKLLSGLKSIIQADREPGEPERKVIIFTEYRDTAKYLEPLLNKSFANQVITAKGDLTGTMIDKILTNFDAVYPGKQQNDAKILLATDQISEGFNLNRAGAIINYDIPWNPTRVIQRVGRINRISKKIFSELFVYNFFPTRQGADVIQSKEIAANKMFLIHNTLGEDSKVFEAGEEPTAAKLFSKINQKPEASEEQSFHTVARQKYFDLAEKHPDLIAKLETLAPRVKTAKAFNQAQLLVFIRKGLGFFVRAALDGTDNIEEPDLADVYELIQCSENEERLNLSETFWQRYEKIKYQKTQTGISAGELSLEKKSLNNLKHLLRNVDELEPYRPFVRALLEDVLEYKTLADYTLRKIANLKTGSASDIEKTKAAIDQLRRDLGPDYLDKVKQKLGELTSEIIIAVENRKIN